MQRIIKSDAATGTVMKMHQDASDTAVVETIQNFDNLLKINKQMSNDWTNSNFHGTQKHVHHVAEIPNVVYNHLLETLGSPRENPKAWKAWLNDSQNRDFRTGGGTL